MIKVGKYHIRLDVPSTIGVDIIKPNRAFLESVKKMKEVKQILIIKIRIEVIPKPIRAPG